MVFSSTVFLFLFLPVVLLLHALAPRPFKNTVLLVASLIFYFWGEKFFVFVMLASIAGNYVFGLLIDRWRGSAAGKRILAVAIVANLALLVGYKYTGWLVENLNVLLARAGAEPLAFSGSQHLPIGISFFTFHALSYVIDLHRGHAHVQRKLRDLALYIALFPQLIAGPIVRYAQIEHQLSERRVDLERLAYGVRRFIVGLAKKVLLATPLQVPVEGIFDQLPAGELTTPIAWLGVIGYMLHLYFDFSGYSDMAVGLGHMFGFKFPENFNYPFVARSVRDLWTRWHISLTTWFRDYLYIPMGGNRHGPLRTHLNLVTVFVLCGLWHGARWNYILFGLYHGIFLVLERLESLQFLRRVPAPVKHAYTIVVWLFGLAIFRTQDIGHALVCIRSMLGFAPGSTRSALEFLTPEVLLTLPLAALCSLPIVFWIGSAIERASATLDAARRARLELALRASATLALLAIFFLSTVYLAASTHHPFIYFRF